MSELLPTITGNGVLLRFTFPFDSRVQRDAAIFWQSRLGQSVIEKWYADITQSGETAVAHEQVTFPGDTWIVREKAEPKGLLLVHTATGEREQRCVVCTASRQVAASTPATPAAPAAAGGEDADPELAAFFKKMSSERGLTSSRHGRSRRWSSSRRRSRRPSGMARHRRNS